jgi:hypothetical protein
MVNSAYITNPLWITNLCKQIQKEKKMNDCTIKGCRLLETKCTECGRLVADAIFPSPQWISLKDKLPPYETRVLVLKPGPMVLEDDRITIDYLIKFPDQNVWARKCSNDDRDVVTHWMPLPEIP